MDLKFSREWLRNHIEKDADLPCEAGGPSAPLAEAYGQITEKLSKLYTAEEISEWWSKPHPQLDGVPAINVLFEDANPEDIAATIARIDAAGYI